MNKRELYAQGLVLISNFVHCNGLEPVITVEDSVQSSFATCAYYRSGIITIDVPACAAVGTAGRAWSYPGYTVDRTPYGVLAHELGHHVDRAHGSTPGWLSPMLRNKTGEEAISSYAPNVNEWFAEIFRVFVTNPDLLRLVRPRMHGELMERFKPVELRSWDTVLKAERQRNAARNKIAQAIKQQVKRQMSLL